MFMKTLLMFIEINIEKPFFVAVNKNIVLCQIKNDEFELYITVPLRKEVRLLHFSHS